MHQNNEQPRSRGLLSTLAALASWGWPRNHAPGITLGNRSANKATRKADAQRRKRANKRRLQRARNHHMANPPGTKAANKARAGQLGVTRRGY